MDGSSGAASPKPTVLAVDDTDDNLFILRGFLGKHYNVHTAQDGEEALRVMPSLQPALVLLDVMMPGIDGFEVCRQIRKGPQSQTKVLMLSARDQLQDRLAGYEAGADDYITKPFDEQELLAKVSVYLKLKHAQEAQHLVRSALSVISHQLYTPLNGILPALEILLDEDSEVPVEAREWLEMAHENSQRLSLTIDKVLFLAGLRSGDVPINFRPVDIGACIESAIDAVRPKANEASITFKTRLDARPVEGDDRLLIRVFESVLDNATRHSPSGGVIEIDVEGTDKQCVVAVRDYGPGIDVDFLPHVFSEFTTVEARHHVSGDGLSMAIAKSVLEMHRGTVLAENHEDGGAVFRLTLPTTERVH
ncbi:MAG: response regulator [Pseudomonadota bacterium]